MLPIMSTNVSAVVNWLARRNRAVDSFDDQLWQTSVERRSSDVLSTYLTDDGPVYHALSVHLSRAKSITRFDDRYAEAKFSKSGVWDKVLQWSTINFEDTRISF